MDKLQTFTNDILLNKIYELRGKSIMLDKDIAELYGVETKRVNEQVKRNIERFPEEFMFRLTENEYNNLKSQNATSSWGGRRNLPYAFSEHGILMLANVLRSERAINMSIRIIQVFISMRKIMNANRKILIQINNLNDKLLNHDEKLKLIFEYISRLENKKRQAEEYKERNKIGYKI